MSLADQIRSDVSNVMLNTSEFGETVTRYPEGGDHGTSVVAIVKWLDPAVMHATGREVKTHAILHVEYSLTCLVTDKWEIGGVEYQAVAVQPAQCGMIEVTVQRCDVESRQRIRGNVL